MPSVQIIKRSLVLAGVLAGTLAAATISGTITFEGKAPRLKKIKMSADPICQAAHKKTVRSEALVLGEGNTIGNVFVKIKSGLKKKKYPTPKEEAVLDQRGCQYSPHVLVVMAGQKIKILNPDGTLHNVHAMPKINKEFNMAMPKFKKKATKIFKKVEEKPFAVKCDVHPWMNSWVAVLSHPFFDVTGKDGKFEIKNVPAGTYTIEVWQEKLGVQTAEITVEKDDSKTVDFTMKKSKKAKKK